MTRRQPTGVESKRCAVYTRKSTSVGLEQSFNSLDAQREACVRYIERQPGWTLLPDRYDDGGFTGANIERPAFQRLLADAEAGKIDVVVVYKVDRLSRSLLDFAKVMERFAASGASFVSITQNFSTADAMGRLTLNMLMSFAEFEREMIGERTRDKISAARRKGKWTGGPVPLGYTVKDKRLVVDELEAVVVREVFALYLEHRAALAVVRRLNERGRATKRHESVKGRKRVPRAFTKADVLRILKNPVYAGFMRSGGGLHESEHEAIVERAAFERANELLDGSGRRSRKDVGRNPDYVLRGLLRCACCASGFTPASTRRGEREYRYYRCVTRDKQGREACPSSPLPADAIEKYIAEQLRSVFADGSLVDEVTAAVTKRAAARRMDLQIEKRRLPAEIASLSAEGKRLAETIARSGRAAARHLEDRLRELDAQIARSQSRLAEAEREITTLDSIDVEAEWVSRCLTEFDTIWDVLTPENRGRLLRAVVDRVEVDEPAANVKMFLVDLGAGVRPESSALQEATA